MGLGNWLFGDGVKTSGEGISSVLTGIGGLAKDVRTAITGKDPEAEAKLRELELMANTAQIDLNKVEASHTSVFVAGWRPFIGWVCGLGLAYHFLLHPLIVWTSGFIGTAIEAPVLDTGSLMSLVLALLGLGGMRSWEKRNQVNDKH